ncbi:MAG: ACT domain-containing protein [Alphaproteobacteria bacterium]|nr:ACT domain-containing protein [Alphaproteobacteria bacterium]
MATTYRLTLTCSDRSGLVAVVTGLLFDLGGNLGDTTFAVYGTEAEFAALVDMPEGLSADDIRGELQGLGLPPGARIDVAPFERSAAPGPMGRVTHVITLSGGDQPGLIARLAEVFGQFGANIVHLEAGPDRGPGPRGQYATRFSVALNAETAATCLATVANTAESLHLDCNWKTVNS